jgi:LuxR family maltose regulon positive regulatory protein
MLVQWSKSIPQSILKEFPRLQLEIAWSIILEWNFADAERIILEVERKTEELGKVRGEAWLDLMRKIIMHRKEMLYLFMDDMRAVESEIEKGINTFPEDDPYMRGNLDTNLLYARRELYRLHDVNKIDGRAREYYDKAGRVFVLVWHESIAGPTWFLKGETERAESSLRRAIGIAEAIEGPVSALAAMPAILLAEILYERNLCDDAADLIARYGSQAEKKGFVDHLAAYYTVKSSLEFRSGNLEAASTTLALGRASAERHGFERLRRRVEREEVRQAIFRNDLSLARQIRASATSSDRRLHPRSGTTSGDETWVSTWARACCALGDASKASGALKQWIVFARDHGAVRSEVRLLIALSVCLAAVGAQKEAARRMREAVRRAAGLGFIRCFLDEGRVAENLLHSLFGEGGEVSDPIDVFGRDLLRAFEKEPNHVASAVLGAKPTTEEETLAPPEALNAREREILHLVSLGFSNKEIALRLSLAEASIKWYLQQIFTKLDVRRRIGAVRRAQNLGLL